ncbi:hypothetical protein BH24ACI4_BH24ACI4_23730 [soil metagenome]
MKVINGRPTRRAAVLGVALVLVVGTTAGCTLEASLKKRVSGNLVFWDQRRGFEAVAANLDIFTEISPFWYRVLADGRVVPYTTASGATYEDAAMVSFFRANRILVIPTVANIVDGQWDGASVSRIINSPGLRDVNVRSLVQLAVSRGYHGIDLDYEDLPASDRTAFTVFVRQLADALHTAGKLLTVNVYAKTSEPGTWSGPQSQDWSAIGAASDQVRIMAYEYHWASSGPGPVAPIDWVREVLEFARSRVPAHKIVHGLPLYGYDWVGGSGVDHVWETTMALAGAHGTTVNWDHASASPWFHYSAQGRGHTVWFENGASTSAKLEAADTCGVGGVTLWRLGGQDPGTWPALRAWLGSAPAHPRIRRPRSQP